MSKELETARIVILTEESRQRLLALGDELVKELAFLRVDYRNSNEQDIPAQENEGTQSDLLPNG